MYISFRNLELPSNYKINPSNKNNIIKDIAYIKQTRDGFKELTGVSIYNNKHFKKYTFHDNILPTEIAVRYDGVPFLTKVLEIKNKEKYRVNGYTVITTTSREIVARVHLDADSHPHIDPSKKYCMPPIVSRGSFTSFRFEKLRNSLFRWNLAECYVEGVPPAEDFVLMPVFIERD